jgi:hypothetical protein
VGAGPLPLTDQGLFPAEHRALRELHATARLLAAHWARLAIRVGGEPAEVLERGAAAARELLRELADRTAAHGLHGSPTAQGVGGGTARARGASDLLLERNQALRGAALEIVHVTLLLEYLARLADRRDDAALAAWHRRWQTRLQEVEGLIRAAAAAEGADPERAIEPAETSALGRAGHSIASGLGTIGEAIDGSRVGRAARRLKSG